MRHWASQQTDHAAYIQSALADHENDQQHYSLLIVLINKIYQILFQFQRYYGKSLPFGQESFSIENVGLLTVEQALADYAVMIKELNEELGAQKCPVIVFGGR